MTATQFRRKPVTKPAAPPARPVTEVLLQLAYLMHATKVVGHRDTLAPRRRASRSI